ncbi:MAG: patatin-like phospholipase family protein [Microcoleus sp.]|uniref:patatin-like phospholipase family protein n=1 Tax=Microcoleus sp. TaxID=44472 RepID=UPI003C73CBD7
MSKYNYKNLALQAGGVLGTAYVGAVQAMDERGTLNNLERVAGASAGAIVGTLIALRFTPVEIEEIMLNLDFSNFTDPTSILNIVRNYGYYAGDFFYKWMQEIVARKLTETATFEDLVNGGYADLYVFATDLTARGLREFSYRSTPDTQIAAAVRASMSIPFFFQAWRFPDSIPDDHYYVDGGIIQPYPLRTFDYPPFVPQEGFNEETLGISLKTGFSPVGLVKPFDMQEYVESLFESVSTMRISARNKLRTVSVDTLNISPTNFKISLENKKRLAKSGYDAIVTFFNNQDEEKDIFASEEVKQVMEASVSA